MPTENFRYYLAFSLMSLLGLLLYISEQCSAQSLPQPASREQQASTYTHQLSQKLRLLPHQYQVVYRSTLRHLATLDSLAATPAVAADYARAEQRYAHAVQPVLAAGQYHSFLLIREPSVAAVR